MKTIFNACMGEKIARYRKSAKLSQEDLANYLKLTRVQISNLEGGNNTTTTEKIYHICQLLKITPNDLFPTQDELKNFVPMSAIEKRKIRIKNLIDILNKKLEQL